MHYCWTDDSDNCREVFSDSNCLICPNSKSKSLFQTVNDIQTCYLVFSRRNKVSTESKWRQIFHLKWFLVEPIRSRFNEISELSSRFFSICSMTVRLGKYTSNVDDQYWNMKTVSIANICQKKKSDVRKFTFHFVTSNMLHCFGEFFSTYFTFG